MAILLRMHPSRVKEALSATNSPESPAMLCRHDRYSQPPSSPSPSKTKPTGAVGWPWAPCSPVPTPVQAPPEMGTPVEEEDHLGETRREATWGLLRRRGSPGHAGLDPGSTPRAPRHQWSRTVWSRKEFCSPPAFSGSPPPPNCGPFSSGVHVPWNRVRHADSRLPCPHPGPPD